MKCDFFFLPYLHEEKKTCTITPLLCLSTSTKESFYQKTMPLSNLKSNCCMLIQGSVVGSSCPGSSLDSSFTEVFGMFTRAFGSRFCFRLPEVCLCPVPVRKPNAANCSADTPAFVLFRDIGPVCFCFPGPSLDFQKASYAPGAWYLWITKFSKFYTWNIKLVTDDRRLLQQGLGKSVLLLSILQSHKVSYCIAWN
jgi:hypothetical protein